MAMTDKRYIGEVYAREPDGAKGKWRSCHSRRISWENLAADALPLPRASRSSSSRYTISGGELGAASAHATPVASRSGSKRCTVAGGSPTPGSGGRMARVDSSPASEASTGSRAPQRKNSLTVPRNASAPSLDGAAWRSARKNSAQQPVRPRRAGEVPAAARASSKSSQRGTGGKRCGSAESDDKEEATVAQPATPQRPSGRRGSGSRLELRLERVEEVVELFKIAKVQKVPVTAVKQAADLFREFGTTHGSPKEWRMVEAQFRNVIRVLSNKQQEPHRRRDHELDVQVREAFLCADTERLGYLDFSKFTFWLSNNSFSEELNLDRDQKEMRNLARKHGLPVVNIERYQRAFREFDQDSSGGIDPEEFENLICKCGKVPQKSMPASRVQQWWRDADSDGNGIVDFEEFLIFQRKYFDLEGNGGGSGQAGGEARRSGFENYYRGIRKHCWT